MCSECERDDAAFTDAMQRGGSKHGMCRQAAVVEMRIAAMRQAATESMIGIELSRVAKAEAEKECDDGRARRLKK